MMNRTTQAVNLLDSVTVFRGARVTCFSALVFLSLACAGIVDACSLPVFRYAIQSWPPTPHRLVVVHRGPLPPDAGRVLRHLQSQEVVEVIDLDLSAPDCPPLEGSLALLTNAVLPRLALARLNFNDLPSLIWEGSVSPENASFLLNPADGGEIARRLLSGDAAVWVVCKGSDKNRIKEVTAILTNALQQAQKTIKLPDEQTQEPYDTPVASSVPLKLSFSVLEISYGTPESAIFRSMVDPITPDGVTKEDTLVVPVFGRGRALHVFAKEAITAEGVKEACEFLCGPCSCEVKEMNPGVDLFCPVDWVSSLYDGAAPKPLLPPLVVPMAVSQPATTPPATVATNDQKIAATTVRPHDHVIRTSFLAAVLVGLVIIVFGTWRVLRSPKGGNPV